jgi:hypothetical protein
LEASFQSRFEHTGDLADISDAISYQQKAVHLTPEGHADMPSWLNNLGIHFKVALNAQEILLTFPMPYHISRKQFISLLRAMQTCPARLNNLGISFQSRFECTGDLA